MVDGVAPLDRAGSSDLSFLVSRRYLPYFQRSQAAIVLCNPSLLGGRRPACRVIVSDPHVGLLDVLPVLYPEPAWTPGVHPSAVIGSGSAWEDPVAIGPYVVLGDGVRLGKNVRIGAGCVLGDGVRVGDDVQMYPHVVCYSGTVIGNRAILHAGVRLGSDGFGYILSSQGGALARKIPQIGRCLVGDDVEIGANTTIDRGGIDDTMIGSGTKIDNQVQIAHNVRIGARCLIAAHVGIAGSTHLEDDVIVGGQAGIADHVRIGRGARLSAGGGAIGDVEAGATMSGFPARSHREFLRAQAALYRLAPIIGALEKLARAAYEPEP